MTSNSRLTYIRLVTRVYIAVERLRAKQRLTQQQLADLSGVPQPRISEMERGVTKHVSLDVLARLAKALRVPAARLISETEERKR
jgi:transcriptional regulator with XRE-family HTH domain